MNDIIFKIIICIIAGVGAGLGTGFAGMSAAVAITPLLISFCGLESYQAITIALASDVLASLVSAITYGKNKHVDIKNGLLLTITVLVFTVVGSYVSQFIGSITMSYFASIVTLLMGAKFLLSPSKKHQEFQRTKLPRSKRIIRTVVCGVLIGFICGFIGAGGGMLMLFLLVAVLGYELKIAVGTSVFVMTFTALCGSISHFVFVPEIDITCLITCVIATFIFARIGSKFANKLSDVTMSRITGLILTMIVIATFFAEILNLGV